MSTTAPDPQAPSAIPRAASPAARVRAQAAMELRLAVRNAENLMVTLGIPLGVLVFFAGVDVLPVADGTSTVDFLVPGVLALGAMGSGMVSLGIATGFERAYLVLKRLGATPLTRAQLVVAKSLATAAVLGVQVTLVGLTGLVLGWRPTPAAATLAVLAVTALVAVVAFAGIGLSLAGRLPALGTLAATNAVFMVLLLLSGVVVPLDVLPDAVASVASMTPPALLAEALRDAAAGAPPGSLVAPTAWLAGWAAVFTTAAARLFRWE